MNKNTIIAIVLSTIVVVASIVLQSIFIPKKPAKPVETTAVEQTVEETTSPAEVKNTFSTSSIKETTEVKEKVIETTTAKIVLTNRGGDIVSYKLKNHIDHIDKETNEKIGVELVDNVSDFNRACAISLGSVNDLIINDLFTVEKEDDYSITYAKKLVKADAEGNPKTVVLKKTYTFNHNAELEADKENLSDYLFKLDVEILNESGEEIGYTLRTSPQIGPKFNPKLNRYENRQFISYDGKKTKKQVISQKQFKAYNKAYVWNGIGGKYFEELVIPQNPEAMDFTYYSTKVEVGDYANAQAIMVRKATADAEIKDSYYMYFGPRNEKALKAFNVAERNDWKLSGKRLNESLNVNSMLGWLETILKWFMEVLNKFVHNWGVSIILMTIIIKMLMFPFTRKQSMSTLKMQEIQPKVQAVQEKYKNNPQKMQAEMQKIYQANGYNPMSGCLPMIVQFMILWSMYDLFNNYFEFRGSLFIPHWIEDLSSGDSVYTFGFNIPFFGNQMRILPFIYLASQLFFGKITGMGGATGAGQTQAQMKMMMYGMPIMFFVLFYNAPSGLLLYWTVSNLFQMGQQVIINRSMKNKKAELAQKK